MRKVRNRMFSAENVDRWQQKLLDARIPERYWTATLEAVVEIELRVNIVQWIETLPRWLGEGEGLYLHGPLESGKSAVAALLCMDAIQRCERVLWVASREVPSIIFREQNAERELYERLNACDLLVVDDLGAESYRITGPAGHAYESLFRIIYDRQRSVIVTSNLSWTQFRDIYSPPAQPLVSVIERVTKPHAIVNDQWRLARGS